MCSIVAGSISWAAWVSRDLIFTKCLMQWWASFSSTLIYFCNISTMYSTCATTTITSTITSTITTSVTNHYTEILITTPLSLHVVNDMVCPYFLWLLWNSLPLGAGYFFYKLSFCINYAITVTCVVIVNSTWTKCRVIWDLWHDLQRQRYS